MNNFFFHNPTKILFGKGMVDNLSSELKTYGTKILLVYGSGSIKRMGLYDKVIKNLSQKDIEIFELSGVKSNPVVSLVRKGIKISKENKVDVIFAVGGGSVMDTAKAIAAGALVEFDVWDFFTRKEEVKNALPIITIPTLPASGSQMNGGAVIVNEKTQKKLGTGGSVLYPKVSILDPELTFSIPTNYTAYCSADMLSHIIEPYFHGETENTTISDSLAETVMKIIIQTTPKLLRKLDNYDARGDLMWAATIAHNGMLSFGTSPVYYYLHVLEHSLSGLFDNPHGAGLSVLISGWSKYTAKHAPVKLAQLGRNVFNLNGYNKKTALSTAMKLEEWFKLINCPVTLQEIGITENNFKAIVQNVLSNVTRILKSKDNGSLKDFGERYYSEIQNKDIESLLKFEKERVLNILELCK